MIRRPCVGSRARSLVDFVKIGEIRALVRGLGEFIIMVGDVRDFRPIVCFGEFISALVGLPPADDVEGNVDLALQSSCEIVCGASVAQEEYFVDHAFHCSYAVRVWRGSPRWL